MEQLLEPSAWGSPVGVGLFLLMLGGFIVLLSIADKNKK